MKSEESNGEEANHKVQSSNFKVQKTKPQTSNFKVQTEQLKTKFDRMMSALYEQRGAQLNISILATDEAQDFINAHASLLDSTFQPVKMSQKMRERLQRSDYVFSGLKTFHELNEAFPSLIDENGDRKPFERFLNDVRRIDETYNAHYLRAEYDFVHSSALMAAKWEQYSEDGDRYLLQYRTAHDDKVRPEHAALDRVTLPMSDRFWEEYFPPNGWNCRCTVERVLRGKYQETPHQEAMQRGDEALNGERYNIFRFNSGMQQKTMPPYNPYTIRRCNDCDIAKGKGVELAFVPENELCAACRLIHQQQTQRNNQRLQRDEFNNVRQLAVNWANNNLHQTTINGSRCKRTIMQTADGHSIGVGKQFFTETAAKAMRDPEVAHLLKTATEFEKWLPNATRIRTEEGRHHGYGFSVYQVIYQGRTIEFKCKMTMGELLYTMKII